ncbi:Ig-like domain-containing protein, partial [Endozoicomonas atrinae]|uniref:Ig-like domain-containing protein n=2 Tax=Endozoicomonas atrinae TaxID=1333660 RepID=UPI000A4D1B78
MNSNNYGSVIGYITEASTTVETIDSNGNIQEKRIGDPVFLDETIINESGSPVVITLLSGQTFVVPAEQQLMMGTEWINTLAPTASGEEGTGGEEGEESTSSSEEQPESSPQQELAASDSTQSNPNQQETDGSEPQTLSEAVIIEHNQNTESQSEDELTQLEFNTLNQQDNDEASTPSGSIAPVIESQNFAVNENVPIDGSTVIGQVFTSDSGDVTYAITGGNEDNTFAIRPTTGEILVTGPLNHESRDSYNLTIEVTNQAGLSESTSISISINDLNEAPEAQADFDDSYENHSVTIDVLANDIDEDLDDTPANFSLNSAEIVDNHGNIISGQGSVTILENRLQFAPGADFDYLAAGESTVITIHYIMSDDGGLTSDASVTITVTGTNDAPVATADIDTTQENNSISVDVIANDSDLDTSNRLSLSAASIATMTNNSDSQAITLSTASISFSGNNVTFDPGTDFDYLAAGETATVLINYTVTDDDGTPLTDSSTLTITVTGTNDAPVLDNSGDPILSTINENTTDAPGQLVSDLFGSLITDVDSNSPKGIAITSADNTNGNWQFSVDNGANWQAVGTLSETSALLLDAAHKIRFVPGENYNGTESITFRAWDQTSGTAGSTADTSTNGGVSAFSSASESASLTITPVNNAPTLTPSGSTVSASTETTSGGGFYGDLVALPDGGFLNVWNSSGPTIEMQRYDSNGVAQGSVITVYDDPNNNTSYNESVAVLNDGSVVVSWTHFGDSADAWAQVHNPDGSVRQAAFQLNSQHTFLSQWNPSLSALGDGGFIAVWSDVHQYIGSGGQYDLYMRRFNADGTARDAQEIQLTNSSTEQNYPSITQLSDGSLAMAWIQSGSVHTQKLDSQGNLIGSPVQVSENTSHNVGDPPEIAALTNGSYVLTWMDSSGQDGEGYGAFARIVDSNGQPIGNEFSVSSDNSLPAQVFPDVTALSDGGFIVTWQSGADLNNGQQIWAQRYDSLGAPVNNAFRVGAGQTDKQPTVVELSDGTLAFSWQDNDAYEIRT